VFWGVTASLKRKELRFMERASRNERRKDAAGTKED
jgi:hypothetical protein